MRNVPLAVQNRWTIAAELLERFFLPASAWSSWQAALDRLEEDRLQSRPCKQCVSSLLPHRVAVATARIHFTLLRQPFEMNCSAKICAISQEEEIGRVLTHY